MTEYAYFAQHDQSVTGITWMVGDNEYKNILAAPVHLMKGDCLTVTLDPAPTVGFLVLTKKPPTVFQVISDPLKMKIGKNQEFRFSPKKRDIDKYDYLLEEK